jgi:polyhydroxyalkanoate synthesis regulator phasin
MDFSNIKMSIGIVVAIIAQAFGIIWYVAQLDSTVGNLSSTVGVIQEEQTTVDIAVLQNDIEALKDKIAMTQEMARMYTVGKAFDSSELEEAIEDLEDRVDDLEDD